PTDELCLPKPGTFAVYLAIGFSSLVLESVAALEAALGMVITATLGEKIAAIAREALVGLGARPRAARTFIVVEAVAIFHLGVESGAAINATPVIVLHGRATSAQCCNVISRVIGITIRRAALEVAHGVALEVSRIGAAIG